MPEPAARTSQIGSTRRPHPAVTAISGCLYLGVCAASFAPGLRLWGIGELAYYPLGLRLALLLAAGIMFIPSVARPVYRLGVVGTAAVQRLVRVRWPLLVALPLLAAACFWSVRSATHLLGDSQMVARSFEVNFANQGGEPLWTASEIIRHEHINPGAMLAYVGAARLAVDLFGASAVSGIRALNCLLGGLVALALLSVLRGRQASSEEGLWLFVSTLGSGAVVLFCGYVEFYPPLIFLAFLYVLAGYRRLATGKGTVAVVSLALLAMFTHVQGVLLGPSLLFLLLRQDGQSESSRLARLAFPLALALTLAVTLAGRFLTPLGTHFLPLFADGERTGALSPTHLLDCANQMLLMLPAFPVIITMLLTRSPAEPTPARRRQPSPASISDGMWTADLHFALLLLVPAVIYLLFFHAELGVARDWDLFTIVAPGSLALARVAIMRFVKATGSQDLRAPVLAPLFLITVVLGCAWIGVNASWERSAARFEHLLDLDRTHSGYARENLALLYYEKGDLPRATRIMEETAAEGGNIRHYVRVARFYAEAGRNSEAREVLRAVLADSPTYDKARTSLVQILESERAYEEMYAVSREGTIHFPERTVYWYYLGESAGALGRTEEAREAYGRVLALSPDPELKRIVESLLERLPPGSGSERR